MASDREVVLHRPLRAERVVDDEREDKVSADARLAAAVRVGRGTDVYPYLRFVKLSLSRR